MIRSDVLYAHRWTQRGECWAEICWSRSFSTHLKLRQDNVLASFHIWCLLLVFGDLCTCIVISLSHFTLEFAVLLYSKTMNGSAPHSCIHIASLNCTCTCSCTTVKYARRSIWSVAITCLYSFSLQNFHTSLQLRTDSLCIPQSAGSIIMEVLIHGIMDGR